MNKIHCILLLLHVLPLTISRKTKKEMRASYPNDTFTSKENKGKTVFELPFCDKKDECVVSGCRRVVIDSFVNDEEVNELLEITRIGMTDSFDLGGPTILDINSGFVRDPSGSLRPLYVVDYLSFIFNSSIENTDTVRKRRIRFLDDSTICIETSLREFDSKCSERLKSQIFISLHLRS